MKFHFYNTTRILHTDLKVNPLYKERYYSTVLFNRYYPINCTAILTSSGFAILYKAFCQVDFASSKRGRSDYGGVIHYKPEDWTFDIYEI